jgi:hypothetical protein
MTGSPMVASEHQTFFHFYLLNHFSSLPATQLSKSTRPQQHTHFAPTNAIQPTDSPYHYHNHTTTMPQP